MWRIMIHMNSHKKWFGELTGHASGRAAAEQAGISPATMNRQIAREHFTAETVISLARAYGRSPVLALLETDFILAEEAGGLTPEELARSLSDQQIIAETARRIDNEPSHWTGTFNDVIERDDLEERRKGSHVSGADDSIPLSAVAYSGPDEDAERNDAYDD